MTPAHGHTGGPHSAAIHPPALRGGGAPLRVDPPKLDDYSSDEDESEDEAEARPLSMKELKDKTEEFLLLVRGNSLYESTDSGWTDRAQSKRVDDAGWAWGNIFFDIDNDRDKDLFVVNGYTTHSDSRLPDF